jgi:hypothetical protein
MEGQREGMSLYCSEMEGRSLMGSLCLYRCACFHEHTTNFSMPTLCSEMEGCALLAIGRDVNKSAVGGAVCPERQGLPVLRRGGEPGLQWKVVCLAPFALFCS